jgi:hypothetical protein
LQGTQWDGQHLQRAGLHADQKLPFGGSGDPRLFHATRIAHQRLFVRESEIAECIGGVARPVVLWAEPDVSVLRGGTQLSRGGRGIPRITPPLSG